PVPAELTATAGVKAGLPVTVLTAAGVLQVAPPLVDVEITAWLTVPPVKRASSQTTYNCPVLASMATSGRLSPVRMAWPVFGSVSATVCSAEATVGCDQLVPPSDGG